MKYNDKKIEEMMLRMFMVIAEAHLNDHKLSPNYCRDFKISRTLGEDIAGFVKSRMPKQFKEIRKKIESDKKKRSVYSLLADGTITVFNP